MPIDNPQYDVAISFLSKDEAIAPPVIFDSWCGPRGRFPLDFNGRDSILVQFQVAIQTLALVDN
jgi:hypothetical protein